MKVLIVTITKDTIHPECLESVLNQDYANYTWMIHMQKPADYGDPLVSANKNCADNRNRARTLALASDADYFLFLDSDIALPKEAISEFLKQPKDIQGGWYQMPKSKRWVCGSWAADNVFANYMGVLPSLIRVDMVGVGCMFISRKALSELTFEPGTDKQCRGPDGKTMWLGECGAFGNQASEKGYDLYMNGSIICKHHK